jgi:hypothetical protein
VMHFSGGVAIAFFFWRAAALASQAGVIGAVNRTGLVTLVFGLTCADESPTGSGGHSQGHGGGHRGGHCTCRHRGSPRV